MNKSIKNAIPKNHFEFTTEYLTNNVNDFKVLVNKIEKICGKYPSFLEFSEKIQNFDELPVKSVSVSEKMLQVNVLFHLYSLHQTGQHFFYVTPQLAIELAKTELNVNTDTLLSPFSEIFVQIDPGLFTIHDHRGEHAVTGFYVYHKTYDFGVNELRIMATSMKELGNGLIDDVNFYYKLILKPGKLKKVLNDYLKEGRDPEKEKEIKKFGGTPNFPHIEEFTFFLVNLMLYLTSKDPDILVQLPVNFDAELKNVKNSAKKRKIEKKREKSTHNSIMVVGSHLIENQKEINEVRNSGGIGGWKLNYRVKVSAHWKTQWYGSEKNGTRRSETIRVQEYEKGPDAAEVFSKKRIVV